MACLVVEPGAADWNAQTNPMSYGSTQNVHFNFKPDVGSDLVGFVKVKRQIIYITDDLLLARLMLK